MGISDLSTIHPIRQTQNESLTKIQQI